MEMETEHPQSDSLISLCSDFLLLGMQIRAGHLELPNGETLKRRILQLLEALTNKVQRAGFLPNDVEDLRYALAAYLDEMVQYSEWPGRYEWGSRPLQAILFGDSQAGVRFFERLREARKRSRAVVEIYYLCLVLGFMGQYQLGGTQDLEVLIEDLRHELASDKVKILSPHGKRPDNQRLRGQSLPFIPLAGGVLVLSIIIVVALFLSSASSRSEALEFIQQFVRS